MIESNELRIGNYAKHFENGIVLTVGRTIAFKTPTNTIRVDVDDLQPITLTEEWLLKFGFKKLSSPEATFSNEYMIIYTHESTGFYYFEYGIGENKKAIRRSECRFIHQLQNLYHALTNEELTLNK